MLFITLESADFAKGKYFSEFNNRNVYLDMNYSCTHFGVPLDFSNPIPTEIHSFDFQNNLDFQNNP